MSVAMKPFAILLLMVLCAVCMPAASKFRLGYVYPSTGPFAPNSLLVRAAHEMWRDNVNARGGLSIGNTSYLVDYDFRTFSEPFNSVLAQNVTETFINAWQPNFIIAPHTSGIGAAVAEVATAHRINNILTAAGSPSVFICDENLLAPCENPFGRRFPFSASITIPASKIMTEGLNLLTIQNIDTVAMFWDSHQPVTVAVAEGAKQSIDFLGLDLVLSTPVPSGTEQQPTLQAFVERLLLLKPDAVIGATFSSCNTFMNIARSLDFNAKAYLMMLPCMVEPDEKQDDTAYVMMAGEVWDSRIKSDQYDENDPLIRYHHFPSNATITSPQRFSEEFQQRVGQLPTFNGMAGYTQGYIIQNAYEQANTFDPVIVQEAIDSMTLEGFCGEFQFDIYGQNLGRRGITLQKGQNLDDEIVAPLFAVTRKFIYPAPKWDERETTFGWYKRTSEHFILGVVVLFMLITMGLVFWITLNRQHRVIRASQPLFVILFLLGTMLMYGAVVFWTLHTDDVHCNVARWLLGVGFGLTYSALFARVYRIGQIFYTKTISVFKLSNVMILPFVGVIVSVEVTLLGLWTILAQSHAIRVTGEPFVMSDDYYTCTNDTTLDKVFFSLLMIFNLGVLAYGMYLVVRIWKLKAVVYNESKSIGLAVYTLAFFIAILFIVEVFGGENRELAFVLRSLCLIIGPFVSVLAILLPKMYYMYIEPDFSTAGSSGNGMNSDLDTKSQITHTDVTHANLTITIAELQQQIKQLEDKIAEYEADDGSRDKQDDDSSRDKDDSSRDDDDDDDSTE